MAFSAADRKAELVRKSVTLQSVADACGVDLPFVSNVVAGRRGFGPRGQQVRAYIAGLLGLSLDEVFPPVVVGREPTETVEQRDGAERRRFASPHTERRVAKRRGDGLK